MDPIPGRQPRVLWSFWLACGLAITGAITPVLAAAGGTDRITGVVIPFGVAAAALAINALTYERGRPLATSLYFVAGIALVYGMLAMITVPLRLAVVGTCLPEPAVCSAGLESPMTIGESTGLSIGIAMGTLAIMVGFFGLLMLFRVRTQLSSPPPVRRDAPVAAVPARPGPAHEPATAEPSVDSPAEPAPAPATPAPSPEPAAAAAAAPSRPTRRPRATREPKPRAELPAPAESAELPAPAESLELQAPTEPLELPAHSSPTEPGSERTPST